MASAKAANTLRAYAADWRHFADWCNGHSLQALPASPETVTAYVAHCAARYRVSTVERRLNAIRWEHRRHGVEAPAHPGLREAMQGIRRAHGTAPLAKAALSVADLRAMVTALPDTLAGTRDRALILLGFAGAFRRSELVSLAVADVAFVPEGLMIQVRRSKTDQDGRGDTVGVSYGASAATCPVRSLSAWLNESGIATGPILRAIDRHGNVSPAALSGYAVAVIVKRTALAAGLPEATAMTMGAHSLRAGHATAAARAGVEERAIMRQGRWRSEKTVRRYIRHGNLFAENSSAQLGL
jgi:integrase